MPIWACFGIWRFPLPFRHVADTNLGICYVSFGSNMTKTPKPAFSSRFPLPHMPNTRNMPIGGRFSSQTQKPIPYGTGFCVWLGSLPPTCPKADHNGSKMRRRHSKGREGGEGNTQRTKGRGVQGTPAIFSFLFHNILIYASPNRIPLHRTSNTCPNGCVLVFGGLSHLLDT